MMIGARAGAKKKRRSFDQRSKVQVGLMRTGGLPAIAIAATVAVAATATTAAAATTAVPATAATAAAAVSAAATTAAVPTTAAATVGAGTLLAGPGLVHNDRATVDLLAVEGVDRGGRIIGLHLDEPEPA